MNPYMQKRKQRITKRDVKIAKENHQVLMNDLKQDK